MTAFNGTSLNYDANGNLTSDGTYTYTWDARNHLTQITQKRTTVATFQYDAFGRRVEKTVSGVTTQYLYDGRNPVEELDGSSPANVTETMLTGLGVDQYFARTDSNGTMSYLTNRLGSTIALANSSGTIATQYSYEPFGATTVTGSSTNPFQFTGRENDGTGLYYYRGRYYSPTFGRFISQDPLGFMAGPNSYEYAVDDPVDFRDPTGHQAVPEVEAGTGAVMIARAESGAVSGATNELLRALITNPCAAKTQLLDAALKGALEGTAQGAVLGGVTAWGEEMGKALDVGVGVARSGAAGAVEVLTQTAADATAGDSRGVLTNLTKGFDSGAIEGAYNAATEGNSPCPCDH